MQPANKRLISGLGLIPWLLLAGCSSAPPPSEAPPPKVTVRHPQQRKLRDYDEYNGWLAPVQKVEVRSRVRGHIRKVFFTDGEIVKKDQLLFELDPEPFKAEIEAAKAKRNIYVAQKEAAAANQARLEDLLRTRAATRREVEKARAETKSFQAQILATDQEIKRRQLDLQYSKVEAPIGGRISNALLTPGNLVNAGGSDPLLTTIYSVDPIYAYFTIDERSLSRYAKRILGIQKQNFTELLAALKHRNLPFEFRLESEEGYPHRGELDFVEPRIDRATGTLQARGVVKNPNGQFVPGSRVQVRIAVGEPYQALLVPDTAVLSDQDKKYLLVVDDKNIVHRRDVTLGKLLDDGMRAIQPSDKKGEGVTKADWVIVEGLQRARINYPVDPMKE
jgi:RND family efflux transporter MFP subunit